jgi:nucleoside-diphosphate-sugar epimerase
VNVTDNQPLTQRECYEWLAAKLQRPVPPSVEHAGERKRGLSNKRVFNQKLRALGWEPRFPTFQDGMEKSVLPAYSTPGA